MKLRNLFIAAVAGLFGLVACEGVEQDLGVAKISIDPLELTFNQEGGSEKVALTATRDWNVSALPEWIALSAAEGKASAKEQTITVTVDPNPDNDREVAIVFNAGMVRATLTVKQAGAKGEYVVPTVTIAEFIKTDGQTEYIISGKVTSVNTDYQYAYINDGTAEVEVYKPSNWGEYADKIKIGATLKAQGVYTKYTNASGKSYDELVGVILEVEEKAPQTDVETVTCAEFIKTDGATEYIISGKVTSMNTDYKYAYINDGTAEVEVYQPTNWSEYVDKIKVGSILKAQGVYTKYTNSSGKTYDELVGVILSVEEGQPGPVEEETIAEAAGDGSQANPFNVAAAIAKAKEVGETATTESYYIKGKVSTVKEAFGTQFGNGTFELVDEGYTAVFTAFRILYLGNQKWVEGNSSVAVGDEIVVVGKIVNYKGNTPETSQGSGYLYSLNGQTGGGDQPGPVEEETTAEAAGDGSQANPFNVAAAIAKAKEVGETATTESYYIKGKVSTVKEAFGTQFGNGTFELVDEGYTAVFTAFRILYFGNQKWVEGNSSVAVGDEIVVVGKIVNYKGNTPETSQGSGYLYSLNGQTSIEQSDVFGVEKTEISVSASATSATVKVTGNVAWTATSTATIDKASGEGAGEIAVSFPANEDTENAKTYTVTLSTTADVDAETITVTITQAKASGQASGEESKITISLTNTTTFAADNGTDVLKGGFAATVEGFKVATYQYKSTSKPITPDQYSMRVYKSAVFYIEAPEGKTIKSLTFKGNDYDNGKYIKDLTGVEGTEGSAVANSDGTIGPWEGSASVVILQAAAAQTRLESVDVVFE